MAETLARLAYDASLRGLDKQERLLEEVRSRTGLLVAVSSLAISFLGRPALDGGSAVVAAAAVAAFAVSVGMSLYILLPKTALIFSLVGSEVYEQLYEFEADLDEIHRRLAYDLDRFWERNDRVMTRLFLAFRVAAGALSVEIVLLLVALRGTLF